ncbi:MAG: type I methionyl aminopeptidase [Silvanigrellales bacterium]|jgi:methionyl aminopeptidase|nr:type I methionyl aminopeptidase [Silvanigrellales bacterium]
MSIGDEHDIEALRRIGAIVASALEHMRREARPGMTTRELDLLGEAFLMRHGARSAPKLTYNFPGTTCISVNHEVAHGIPGERVLREGDLVNIDVSAEKDGYFGDTGASFVLCASRPNLERLLQATREARDAGIAAARHGARLSDIGKAVEKVARKHGYVVIRNLGSHGVGRALHEEPKHIPNHFDPSERRILSKGMVITIEPFLTTGPDTAKDAGDGWTLQLPRSHRGAQFEHTIVITEDAPLVMTQVDEALLA